MNKNETNWRKDFSLELTLMRFFVDFMLMFLWKLPGGYCGYIFTHLKQIIYFPKHL